MISTVDPQARHGHKTSHRGFDGYKGHIAVDPDVEVITATAFTAGNAGDVEPVAGLIADLTDPAEPAEDTAAVGETGSAAHPRPGRRSRWSIEELFQPAKARSAWTTTRSAAGPAGTVSSPWPCSPWPY